MPKLLIVDDDEMIRYTLQEICEYAEFESIAAENGRQALQRFRQETFDMVLVDYYMPEMDGLETVQAIRRLNETIPIIVLTVDERQETVSRFFAAGATDFALKPVRAPDLISRMQINLKLSKLKQQQMEKQREVMVTKGISENTLQIIVQFLKEQTQPVAIEVITDAVGLAYPTVHRYIAFLLEEGLVRSLSNYRKIGRPKNQYIWCEK